MRETTSHWQAVQSIEVVALAASPSSCTATANPVGHSSKNWLVSVISYDYLLGVSLQAGGKLLQTVALWCDWKELLLTLGDTED